MLAAPVGVDDDEQGPERVRWNAAALVEDGPLELVVPAVRQVERRAVPGQGRAAGRRDD